MLKHGDKVMVYQDPITERKPEGRAALMLLEDENCGTYDDRLLQRWLVRFETEPESTYVRTVTMKLHPDTEICCSCGKSVKMGDGLFIDRVPDLNDPEVRADNGREFPQGDWVCVVCDHAGEGEEA